MHKHGNNITKWGWDMVTANNWCGQEILSDFKGDRFLEVSQSRKVLWKGEKRRQLKRKQIRKICDNSL